MSEQPNFAPWGTHNRMRLMAVVGPLLSALLLVAGVVALVAGGRGGGVLIAVGGILLVFWLIALPVARRRSKV